MQFLTASQNYFPLGDVSTSVYALNDTARIELSPKDPRLPKHTNYGALNAQSQSRRQSTLSLPNFFSTQESGVWCGTHEPKNVSEEAFTAALTSAGSLPMNDVLGFAKLESSEQRPTYLEYTVHSFEYPSSGTLFCN